MHQARNRLMALLATNRAKPKVYEIRQASTQEASIFLYDMIDPFWGVSAKQFVKDLNALSAETIHLHINSPGGDVFEGRAMATAIAQHPSKIIAHVDGLAASAASTVAIAATEVEMAPATFFMIHNAWTLAYGNAEDLKAMAGVLEKIDASLIEDYAKQTGADPAQIKDWMAAETWFSAEEAVAEGFADRVSADSSSAQNAWDLSVFLKAPAALANPATEKTMNSADLEHAERRRRFELQILQRIA